MGFLSDANELRLTAADVAAAVAATRKPIVGSGRLRSYSTPDGGTVMGLTERPSTDASTLVGRIIATDSGDFDDERYYVAIQTPVGGEDDTENLLFSEGNAGEYDPSIIVAHNLAEWADGGGSHSLPSDGTRYVKISAVEDHAGTTRWVMSEGTPGFIPLDVSQNGGADGDASSPASWTYDCTNALTGVAIDGGPYSVTCSRVRNGTATAATHGTGYYASDGTFVLWWVDEKLGSNACT